MELLQRLTRRQVDTLRSIVEADKDGRGAPLKAIAARLKVSSPSALDHVGALEDLKLVERHRGKSHLTESGRATIVEYQRHHRVAESLFQELGLSPEETCEAAREVDLALSHRTIEQVCEGKGHPVRCPHGQPIPPCKGR